MKRSVFTVLLFFACTSFVFSADFVASVTGPYNVAATWGGGGVPVAADNIEINAGVTVTMVANVTGINLVRVNGTLDLAGNDLTSNDFAGTGVVDNSSAGTTSTFTFGDGSTRTFSGRIRDTGVGSFLNIVKEGSGLQFLSGTTSNDFSGTTSLNAGKLVLNKSDGVESIGGDVFVGNSAGQDILELQSSNQINDNAVVTINSFTPVADRGRFNLNGHNETIGGLSGTGGDGQLLASESGTPDGPQDPSILTINVNGGESYTFDGNIRDQNLGTGTPKLSIVKSGAGTQVLMRISTVDTDYNLSGTISVSDGKLLFDNVKTLNLTSLDVTSTTPDALTFNQTTETFTAGFPITGTGDITKTGSGELILNDVNTYTGKTDIQAGTLTLGVANAIPATNSIEINGTLDLNGSDATFACFEGSGIIDNTSGTGTYTLSTGSSNLDKTFSGSIRNTTGTVGLFKEGTGTLTLSGNSTFTGDVDFKNGNILDGGIIALTNSGALGIGPKDINMPGGNANQNQIRLSNNITISNMNIFTRGRNGTNREILINTSGDNTWDGDITINGTGGAYEIQSDAGSLTIVGDLGKNIANNRTFSFRGNGDVEIQGVISDGSAGGTTKINKGNSGVLTLSGTNTYSGNTELTGGTIRLGASNVLPNTTTAVISSGIIDMNGFTDEIGAISGAGRVDNVAGGGNSTLTFGALNTNTTYSGNIVNNTGTVSVTKTGTGTTTISGNNTYEGTFRIEDGTIVLGSTTALSSNGDLAMKGTGVLDLNSFDTSVEDITDSDNTAQITDNSSGVGTTTFSVTDLATQIDCLILDGPDKSIAFHLINRNTSIEAFDPSSANTFSGGLTLKDGSGIGSGTRLLIRSVPTNVGVTGAITSSPFGTGTIFLGENATDRVGVYFSGGAANAVILNDIIFNSKLGAGVNGSIRCDVTNVTMEGTMTSNLSDISVSAYNGGSIRFTGQLTGLLGVDFGLTKAPTAGFAPLTVTFDNQTASINNYMNSTTVSEDVSLVLNAVAQIPDASATVVDGTLQMRGFSETVGSIAGSGLIDNTSGTGTYTLRTGGDDTDTEFSGVIQNTSGILALFKEGDGTLTLSGNSTFTGNISFPNGTDADGGIISVTNSGGLGIGPKIVRMRGDNNSLQKIQLSGGISINNVNIETRGKNNGNEVFLESISGNNFWGGDITITVIGGRYHVNCLADKLTLGGTFSKSIGTNRTYSFYCTGGDIEVTGVISNGSSGGRVSIEKEGDETLVLSGVNTYSGTTTISNGIVQLANTSALGTIANGTTVADGGSLDLTGINYSALEPLTVQGTGDGGNGAIYNSNASAGTFAGPITLAANATFTAGNNMTLSGDISGSGFDLTKNGANTLTFGSNTVTVEDLALTAGAIDAGTSTINIEEAFTSSGTFTPNNGEVRFIGTALQTIPDVDFHDLEIVNASGVNLSADIAVDGLVDMTTGILNTGAFEIDLGSAGSLDESNPNTLAPTSYITGDVKATRNLIQSVANTFGNLGLTITEANIASNSTVVIRTTGTAYTAIGNSSILRGFDISPTTNTGLDATLVSDYFNHEIGGHTEANLVHYRSTNGGTSWTERSTSVNIGTNKATTSGISAFSIWTLSDVTNEPLPINLTNFYADVVRGAVELTWVTASEINNDFFTIEKSTDGINWVVVGKVSGSGSTREETTYHFTDNDPFNGQSYYKLTQTDFNGDKESFDQVSVNLEGSLSTTCSLYPLPASGDELNLLINGTEYGEYDLELVNSLGITLESFSVMHNSESNIVDIKRFTPSHILEHNYLVLKLDGVSKCVQKVVFE